MLAAFQMLSNGLPSPVVSLPTGAASAAKCIKKNQAYLNGFRHVVLCFDNDEAGQAAAEACGPLLKTVKICHLPVKDAHDMLMADRVAEFKSAVFNAVTYMPKWIAKKEDFDPTTFLRAQEPDVELPFSLLNKMLGGVRFGEIVTFTAASGVGKTTLVKEIIFDVMNRYPHKIANIFQEEGVRKCVETYMALDRNIKWADQEARESLTDEELSESFDRVWNDRMVFLNGFAEITGDNLFSKLEYLVENEGCKIIALDHISIIFCGNKSSSQGERKDLEVGLADLRRFTEKHNVMLLLVSHISRPKDSDKDYSSGKQITMTKLKGSSAIENISDAIVAINCNKQADPNRIQLSVLKNRASGLVGDADDLIYNHHSGRLTAAPQEDVFEEDEDVKDLFA